MSEEFHDSDSNEKNTPEFLYIVVPQKGLWEIPLTHRTKPLAKV